ncbi:hypothetical protein LINPERHAP2_LOCUS32240 [Linum perenne]
MSDEDPWVARDKLYHILFCRSLKEVADHLGIFPSVGASAKDAVADLIGVLVAAFALSICRRRIGFDSASGQTRRVLLPV